MLQTEHHIESPHTKDLPLKMDLAIEEARLVRKAIALNNHLRQLENIPDKTTVTSYIRLEIADLESRIADVRVKASI